MSPEVTAAIIAASVSGLTLIGTLAAQYFGRRATSRDTREALQEQWKQLERTLAEQRTRTLNERFATASEQLGSDKPAVRLAGVHAMAGLADDWEKNRQTCVDVLCANLRMPYARDPGQDAPETNRLVFQAIREVRHTVIRVISAHLHKDAAVSWCGADLDFTGVVFDGGDFTGAEFSGGRVNFGHAVFSGGTVDFSAAVFSGGTIDFLTAEFSGGEVDFSRAEFSGGTVSFSRAVFSGGEIDFSTAVFSGGEVDFITAEFSGSTVNFGHAEFSGGTVSFRAAKFSGGKVRFMSRVKIPIGTVRFISRINIPVDPWRHLRRAVFSGGEVDFSAAVFSGSTVIFAAVFSGGTVDFGGAAFSGGTVSFGRAAFSGGTVEFYRPASWSSPPTFPWTDTPPSGVKLPDKEDRSRK